MVPTRGSCPFGDNFQEITLFGSGTLTRSRFGFKSSFQNVFNVVYNKYSLPNASDLANPSLSGVPCGEMDWAPIYDVAVKRLQYGDEQAAGSYYKQWWQPL